MKKIFAVLFVLTMCFSMPFALPAAEAAIEFRKYDDEVGTIIASGTKLKASKKMPLDGVLFAKFFVDGSYRAYLMLNERLLRENNVQSFRIIFQANGKEYAMINRSLDRGLLRLYSLESADLLRGLIIKLPDEVIESVKAGGLIAFRIVRTNDSTGPSIEWTPPKKVLQEWREVINANESGVNSLTGKPVKLSPERYMPFYHVQWQDETHGVYILDYANLSYYRDAYKNF